MCVELQHALSTRPQAGRYAMLSTVPPILVTRIVWRLCGGGTLVLAIMTSVLTLEACEFLGQQHIDVLKITPSMYKVAGRSRVASPFATSYAIFGGELASEFAR